MADAGMTQEEKVEEYLEVRLNETLPGTVPHVLTPSTHHHSAQDTGSWTA